MLSIHEVKLNDIPWAQFLSTLMNIKRGVRSFFFNLRTNSVIQSFSDPKYNYSLISLLKNINFMFHIINVL